MRKKNNTRREQIPDLSKHAEFLRDVIKTLKEKEPSFAVYICGNWYSVPWTDGGRPIGLCTVRVYSDNTGGHPRGVLVREGRIFILFQPTVVDGVPLDDSLENSFPLCLIEKKKKEFMFTPALLLENVRGKGWQNAWGLTVERWKQTRKTVPDFSQFLEGK